MQVFVQMTDSAIFSNSEFGKAAYENTLGIPHGKPVPGSFTKLPFTIVADKAFGLHPNLMRPFPGRKSGLLTKEECIFNYRLSRVRIKVENAFGILSQCWRIFHREINLQADYLTDVVLATCVLHNFLQKPRKVTKNSQLMDEEVHGDLGAIEQIPSNKGHNYSEVSKWVCNMYLEFFNGYGAVPWQNKAAGIDVKNN